jgi:REP element-mobilizing transposase RayT
MDSVLYPRRRNLDHSPPWGVEYPEYFLTICCRTMGTNQLCRTGVGEKVIEAVRHYHTIRRWHCELMVLMPDHLHALVSPIGKTSIHEVLRSFKSWTAKHAKVVWQNGFFEHRLRDGAGAEQKWKYVNENPVRQGLIQNPKAWPWRFTGGSDRPVRADHFGRADHLGQPIDDSTPKPQPFHRPRSDRGPTKG